MIEALLAGNRRFVQNEFLKNETYYQSISSEQRPQVLWIGCSDSRVSESNITDSRLGGIFVHRNIANIVAPDDVNFGAIIRYAIRHLKIPDIIVCGHYDCGGLIALEDGLTEAPITEWLLNIRSVKAKVDEIAEQKKLSRTEKLNLLTEENVTFQVNTLKNLPLIKNGHSSNSKPRVHGWVYSLKTGLIKVLIDGNQDSNASIQ